MKRVVITGLFFWAGITAASAQVKLSFNPEKGAKYEFRMETIMSQTIVAGQEMKTEMEMDMTYLMEVSEKTPQETQARFTYQDIAYIITNPMMKMSYDSKNPTENPSEVDNILGKMFGAMIGKPFTTTIASDGSVTSVNMDEIVASMTQSVTSSGQMAAQIGAAVGQQFNGDALKSSFEQNLKIYPDHAVKPGDSWTMEGKYNITTTTMSIKSRYVLKEINKNEATIAVESTLEMDMGEAMGGKMAGKQEGVMLVDVKTGLPLSSGITQNLSGTFNVQGMDMKMDMTTRSKTSTKKVK